MSSEAHTLSDINENYFENQAIDTDSIHSIKIDNITGDQNTIYLSIKINQRSFFISASESELINLLNLYQNTYEQSVEEIEDLNGFTFKGTINTDLSEMIVQNADLTFELHDGDPPSSTELLSERFDTISTELLKKKRFMKTYISDLSAESDTQFSFKANLDHNKTVEFSYQISQNTAKEEDNTAKLIEEVGQGRVDFMQDQPVYIIHKDLVSKDTYNCGSDVNNEWLIYSEDGYTQYQKQKRIEKLLLPLRYLQVLSNVRIPMKPHRLKRRRTESKKTIVFAIIMLIVITFFESTIEYQPDSLVADMIELTLMVQSLVLLISVVYGVFLFKFAEGK